MPELPEVEVVRRGLVDHVVGQAFVTSSVRGQRVARRHLPGPEHLEQALLGRRVLGAQRRGKYLWLELDGALGGDGVPAEESAERNEQSGFGEALVVHLGMSGQVLVERADAPMEKHAHAVFDLSGDVSAGGSLVGAARTSATRESMQMRFVDQRTFGGVFLDSLDVAHGRPVPRSIAHIAPDPLEDAFDVRAVARLMRSKNVAVKRMLLDQTVVSGIGNIYADEALWAAGVHGRRLGSSLSLKSLEKVLDEAAQVMWAALAQGGTSFDALYVNVNGTSGYFDRSLHAYGQTGKPCERCGTLIVREQFMNRSSHFCQRCQKPPR